MTTRGPALLFCPADRPDRFAKAEARSDTTILDLEDAVVPERKQAARDALRAALLDPSRTVVRVNSASSGHLDADLAALRETPFRTVMLAKAEDAGDLPALGDLDVIALCETPRGIRNAESLADHPSVVALTWGAEDLTAGLAGRSSRGADGGLREVMRAARARVLLAAASAGKDAFDTVFLDVDDEVGLRAEAYDAAESGFSGTLCIHPRQVEVVRDAFRPSQAAVDWARSVLAAAESESGVFRLDGRMVDEPVLRQARRTLDLEEDA